MKWQYWVPDFGQEEKDAKPAGYEDICARFIAESLVEDNFCSWDFPNEIDICLVNDKGEKFIVEVSVESSPVFIGVVKKL